MYLTMRGQIRHKGLVVVLTGVTYGAGMLFFAFSQKFQLSLVFTFTSGMSAMLWLTTMNATVQTMAAEEMRGRVMSISSLGVQLYALGWLVGAIMATSLGNQGALFIAGIILAAFHLLVYARSQEVRRID